MIIYNVTVKVETAIAADWLRWLKTEHIPDIIATGCFTHATVARLLETEEEDGITYVVQYHAPGKAWYDRYLDKFAGDMRNKGFEKWGNRFIAFRSVMQVED